MASTRVSNKQVLEAIQQLTAVIAGNMTPQANQAPVVNTTPETSEPNIQVDKGYLAHMTTKVAEYAADKGEDAILYARKNLRGETKLAYCTASKWTELKDRRVIGAIKHIPAS